MFILLRMKPRSSFQGFVSTSYLGEVVDNDDGEYNLKNTCTIYEVPQQLKKGEQVVMDIVTSFYTDNIVSDGILKFRNDDILFTRMVLPDDGILVGYNSALEKLRLSKINILKAQANEVPNFAGRN